MCVSPSPNDFHGSDLPLALKHAHKQALAHPPPHTHTHEKWLILAICFVLNMQQDGIKMIAMSL